MKARLDCRDALDRPALPLADGGRETGRVDRSRCVGHLAGTIGAPASGNVASSMSPAAPDVASMWAIWMSGTLRHERVLLFVLVHGRTRFAAGHPRVE